MLWFLQILIYILLFKPVIKYKHIRKTPEKTDSYRNGNLRHTEISAKKTRLETNQDVFVCFLSVFL